MLDNIESDGVRGAIIGGGLFLGVCALGGLSYAIAGGVGLLLVMGLTFFAFCGAFVNTI